MNGTTSRVLVGFTAALLLGPTSAPHAADGQPFLAPTLPTEQRVQDFLGKLTLVQKAQVLNHRGPTVTVDGFALRADQWNQCLNGVMWDRPTTLFPICLALAATWDTDLVGEIATVLSDEGRAVYNGWHLDRSAPGEHKGLIYRAPVINIGRSPYWGRNHEAWGEDPFLTGRMAVSYVRGLQGDDPRYLKLAATLKHFAVNNVETDRTKLDAKVPERCLREYWLPHFRDAVVEGGAQSLMASYNAINGTPNNVNRWLLTDVLKNEWGHGGFAVSDLGGVGTMVRGHAAGKLNYVDAVAQSLTAGCDFSDKEYEDNIPVAVREGKLSEARLNDAVARVLRVRFRLGEFDPFEAVPYSRIAPAVICSAKHRAVALRAAQQSIVLLQNRDRILPLDRAKLKRIAVLGPLADRIVTNNYNGKTGRTVTPLQGIRDRVGSGVEVVHAPGTDVVEGAKEMSSELGSAPLATGGGQRGSLAQTASISRTADVAVVFVGTDRRVEHEGRDRKSLGLTGGQEELVKAVLAANPRTIVVEMSAGPLTVPWLKNNVPALLQAWWPGEEGGHAIADVLFGDVNPAGRLPHTVYASEDQVPPLDQYDVSQGFTYMYVKGAPLFPFGHGLGYTTFEYSNLRVSSEIVSPRGTLTLSVNVQNTGSRAGDEVVQLYIVPPQDHAKRPAKMLRGFQRITLQPHAKKEVAITLVADRLAFWDEAKHGFVVESGTYGIQIGASSADIRLRGSFEVRQ